MRTARILTALAVAATIGLTAATPAHAAYPPGPASLQVSQSTVHPTDPFNLIGTNYGPSDAVTITVAFNPQAARRPHITTVAYEMPLMPMPMQASTRVVTADASGSFTITGLRMVDLVGSAEADEGGVATFTGTGAPSGRSANASLTVLSTEVGAMPTTGNGAFSVAALGGLVALLAGVLLLVVVRFTRRRRA